MRQLYLTALTFGLVATTQGKTTDSLHSSSAGRCGSTSVSTIPGCWGLPACAYRIVDDPASKGLCIYNYCDCDGTAAPLLPETVSGSLTLGCASYTVQPTRSSCPATLQTVPTQSSSAEQHTAPSTAATSNVETLTVSGHGLITLSLSAGVSITGTTTLTTDGSTLTLAPTSSSALKSIVQTVTDQAGSTTILTLPSGSSVASLTTISTSGTKLTVAPLSSSARAATTFQSAFVVDGSTIPIPSSSSTTVIVGHSSTLIVGPSSIIENGKTIPIPTAQTALTTDGLTLTFTTSKSSKGSSAKTNGVQSAASVTGTYPITAPPSGSPGYIPTTAPKPDSTQSGIAIILDNESFVLPQTVSVELLQTDGSFITLFSDSIVSGTSTVSLSSPASATSLSLDGLSIEARPQPTGTTHSGGASGLTGLLNSLEGLAGNANAIVNTLDQIGAKGVLWAAGSLSTADFAGDALGLLDSATSGLSSFMSTMGSTIDTFELDDLSSTAQGRVFSAYEGAREEFDILNALKKILGNLPTLKNNALSLAKDYWTPKLPAAAAIAGAGVALRQFGAFDWGSEKQKHTSTITASSTNITVTMSKTSGTESSSSEPAATPTLYFFKTKWGTDVSTFEQYIKTLPDNGQGDKFILPLVPYQMYQTNLTAEQAKEVEKQDFVRYINPVFEMKTATHGTIPRMSSLDKRVDNDEVQLQKRPESPNHLRVISQERDAALDDYLFDPSLGSGQTIYVLDSGFNMQHTELAANGRRVASIYIPNKYTLAPIEPDRNKWAPDDISDLSGHGTAVASVAGGVKLGVASRADLVLVKFKQFSKNPLGGESGKWHPRQAVSTAFEFAVAKVIEDVLERKQSGPRSQSVVNLSGGFEPGQQNDFTERAMHSTLDDMWALDIITVVAAGNDGTIGRSLDGFVPQSLGTATNGLITVGGVDVNGVLDPITTFDSGAGGSLSVYALSKRVTVANYLTDSGFTQRDGTSFAAPAVAGLAAYFASLQALNRNWKYKQVPTDMKDYIVKHAYQRSTNPIPDLPGGYVAPRPDSIIVAYNRAPEGLCSAHLPTDTSGQAGPARLIKRQDSSGDIDVVVNNTIIVPSLSQSYCYNTSFPTLTLTSSTASSTSQSLASPSPTINTDQGILTCGTRTDAGDEHYWFSSGDANVAINTFCHNLTVTEPPIIYSPADTPSNRTWFASTYTASDNAVGPIYMSAKWNAFGDSGCPTLDMSSDNAFSICQDRLNVPIKNCDTNVNAYFGKQGGKFYRDCITWQIASNNTIEVS